MFFEPLIKCSYFFRFGFFFFFFYRLVTFKLMKFFFIFTVHTAYGITELAWCNGVFVGLGSHLFGVGSVYGT